MNGRQVVLLSGVRTAIGDYGGALKDVPPSQLGATVVREAIARAKIDPDAIGQCVVGNVIHTEPRDMYMARVAAVEGGLPVTNGALTLNRLCGSGLQAIVSAAQYILLGDTDAAIGAGAESMSRAPYANLTQRWGSRMGDAKLVDMMAGALSDPFEAIHMGVTAENVARQCNISRADQDAFAVESHRRAAAAIDAGHFKSQIVGIELKTRKGVTVFDTDEHVRADVSAEELAKLRPVFRKDGSVTAANASGLNDGAAALVVMSREEAERRGAPILGRIASWASAGVDPSVMGIGPVPASRRALEKAGWTIGDLDLIEANEAFAAQALAVGKELGWDSDRVNVNGGAIAIGHPIGASGARVLTTLLHEMKRRDAKKGLATLCIGGGMGIALCIERD
jgi:acetyl-CoA C-acetyltransferase